MTVTIIKPDSLESLDWILCCQRRSCPENNELPATHYVEIVTCGCAYLICQRCADELAELLRRNPTGWGHCSRCNRMLVGPPSEHVRLMPL